MHPWPHNSQMQMVRARQEAELALPRHFGAVTVTQSWHWCARLSRGWMPGWDPKCWADPQLGAEGG